MKINKTTEFFHISEEEAGRLLNEYDTVEEANVLNSGLEHYFFQTLECLEKEYNSEERKIYSKTHGYEVIVFEFVADNSNHNKYCMVFR